MPETPALRYSYEFATRVYTIFSSQHQLGIEFFHVLYPRVPRNFPIRLIATGSGRWNLFKFTIRYLEKCKCTDDHQEIIENLRKLLEEADTKRRARMSAHDWHDL